MNPKTEPAILLTQLPGTLDWVVGFRVESLATLADLSLLTKAFGLSDEQDVKGVVYVILTSAGRCLGLSDGGIHWLCPEPPTQPGECNLSVLYQDLLVLQDMAESVCFAVGKYPDQASDRVSLSLHLVDGEAHAEAVFTHRPDAGHWPLLAAVGVMPLECEPAGNFWRVRFRNRLTQHLLAGALAGFSRTANCNAFFLKQGKVDGGLLAGLRDAASRRVQHARDTNTVTARGLALAARHETLAMTSLPPAGEPPRAYGDLVPLGLLLMALNADPEPTASTEAAAILLTRHLNHHRAGSLWAFHRGRLPTATDSALILMGVREPDGIDALARFSTSGGMLPQLTGETRGPETMAISPGTTHWCQPDFGTSCLTRALRIQAGVPAGITVDDLEVQFATRGSLFFANPFFTDWCLAEAIAKDPAAGHLVTTLRDEILAAASPQGQFGTFDSALSTALAIYTLSLLGVRDRRIRIAQLRLLDLISPHASPSRPFYSTTLRDPKTQLCLAASGVIQSGQRHWLNLTLYEDSHRIIQTAFTLLALNAPCDDEDDVQFVGGGSPHPRYLASSIETYIAEFALPPYLDLTL